MSPTSPPQSAVPHSADPHSAAPHSAAPHSAAPHSADTHSADPHSADPHSADVRLGALVGSWRARRWAHLWGSGVLLERFTLNLASPAIMDALWADGWRHFGAEFFKSLFDLQGRRLVRVLPLRVDLSRNALTRDQRRALKGAEGLEVRARPARITEEHEQLFARHSARFTENRPRLLTQFISPHLHLVPCPVAMCEVREAREGGGGRLLAASYFDVGAEALSSVYAFFEPEGTRGLGTLTLLKELEYARREGRRYLYTGYAHLTPSHYDYKKRLLGTEFFDGVRWRPLESLELGSFVRHVFELEDIPLEFLPHLNVDEEEALEADPDPDPEVAGEEPENEPESDPENDPENEESGW